MPLKLTPLLARRHRAFGMRDSFPNALIRDDGEMFSRKWKKKELYIVIKQNG